MAAALLSTTFDSRWWYTATLSIQVCASSSLRTRHTKDAHLTFSLGCPRQIVVSQGSPAQRTPGWPSAHGSPLPTAARRVRIHHVRCHNQTTSEVHICPVHKHQHCRPWLQQLLQASQCQRLTVTSVDGLQAPADSSATVSMLRHGSPRQQLGSK